MWLRNLLSLYKIKLLSMIFIEGNIPSSKNSKIRTRAGFMIMSKTCQKYLKEFEHQWTIIPKDFKKLNPEDFPITVAFHFTRGTHHRWVLDRGR